MQRYTLSQNDVSLAAEAQGRHVSGTNCLWKFALSLAPDMPIQILPLVSIVAHELEQSRCAQLRLVQEYKAKLRNEYLSLGGSPNTVRFCHLLHAQASLHQACKLQLRVANHRSARVIAQCCKLLH